MLSEPPTEPGIPQANPRESEIEPISPEAAEVILKQAMAAYLDDGWYVLHEDAYSARLTRGVRNLDIRVDLLGEVDTTESGLTPLQDSGRLLAWVVLIAMLLVALALTSALGIL